MSSEASRAENFKAPWPQAATQLDCYHVAQRRTGTGLAALAPESSPAPNLASLAMYAARIDRADIRSS